MTTRLLVLEDPREEGWFSMDLAANMLASALPQLPGAELDVALSGVPIRRLAQRTPIPRSIAFNVDRMITRFGVYPWRAVSKRSAYDLFHVADHSYAQLVHVLPAARTGVFCHDVDTFRSVFQPESHPRPAWFRAMMTAVLRGMQRAAVVFHSTRAVRDEILRYELVPAQKLVAAPYGIEPSWFEPQGPCEETARALAPVRGRPFVLHVGSGIARKRLDVLFRVFARLRASIPELQLVQQGARLSDEQRKHVRELGLEGSLHQPPRLERSAIAGLYRGASLVLLPSDAEGFGFPIIEGLASGATVLASDLPVLREVGGEACLYRAVGDIDGWVACARGVLEGSLAAPSKEAGRQQAGRYTWEAHARTVWRAYENVLAGRAPSEASVRE